MKKEETKGMWKRTFSLLGKFTIPWHLYVIQILLGIVNTKVALLYVPYFSKLETGSLDNATLAGYFFFALLNCMVEIVCNVPGFYAAGMVTRELQKKMVAHSLRLPMKQYEKNASNLVSWINNDCMNMDGFINSIVSFITGIFSVIMTSASIGELDPSMVALVPALIIVMILFTLLEGWLMFLRERRLRRADSELTAYFAEHLSYLEQIKQMHSEESELIRSKQAIKEYYLADIYKSILTLIGGVTSGSLTNIVTIMVFVLGVPLVRKGTIDIAGLAAFQSYIIMAYQQLSTIPSTYTSFMYYNGTLFYIANLMDEKEEVVKREYGMDREDENIVFDKVSFRYDDKPTLNELSFEIPKGKVTAIVGPNGSGKSTIFKLIERFYEPNEGKILFGEDDVESIHLDEWRQSMAYVLQEPQLFDGSIRDNITYGMDREVSDEEVLAVAKLACVDEFVDGFPEGYDYMVGENGVKLSTGQRQRIAIARALMLDPAYLLLDEATCNMDIYSERSVIDALLKLMENRTTVMITHDMRMLQRVDNVVVINEGKVEAYGPKDKTLGESETLQKFVYALAD
ncbi:MAG: ABC transporter ATP-binding protein/permease [Lachnospiraceae bacterium]|nr:ABC transporter ATP-binding protein/permease [Lachnospiraceae bacterium]